MLHIITHYKMLFSQCILNKQVWGKEWLSADVDKAVKSSDILTITEYKALLEKYSDNEAELNKVIKEGIKDQLYRDARVLGILNKYSSLSDTVIDDSTEQRVELSDEVEKVIDKNVDKKVVVKAEKIINTDIFNRTLKKWVEWSDVMALQEFLNTNYKNRSSETPIIETDWKFGKWTKKALQAFQKTLGYTNPDGVLTVSNKKIYKTLASIKEFNTDKDYKTSYTDIYARTSSSDDVKVKINTTWESLDNLDKMNKKSDEFYKAMEAYYDGWFRKDVISDMWGVLGWLEEWLWANNADDYFEKMETYKETIEDNEDKFNEEFNKILNKTERDDWSEYTSRDTSLGWYAVRDIVLMAVFQDLPLFDIRLNFAKNLISHGVPMDKALALKNWVAWWMEWEPDYSKENLDKISGKDSLSWLLELRATLTSYGFSNKQIEFALKGELEWLTSKQKKTLLTIINDRILPDLETLRIGWFNFIERWFDDKDNEIKNRINKLTWNEYDLWTVNDIIDNEKIDIDYDVTLRKIAGVYVLNIDDWGNDSYKMFTSMPDKSIIKKYVTEYSNKNESNWLTSETMNVGYSATETIWWKENPDTLESFNVMKVSDSKYIIEKDWKFKEVNSKPTQNDINNYYDNNIDTFNDSYNEWSYDNNISIEEKLKLTWEILILLKEQDTEEWFFGTEDGLTEGIKRVDSRYEYTKWINEERDFFLKAIEILKVEDKELFKKFSMISTFWTVTDFLSAFPSNDLEIRWYLSSLETADSLDRYVNLLKQINKSTKLNQYFNVVFNAHKSNSWMSAWKNYRIWNIPKETWLTRINNSVDRQFKYWEALDINATAEEALNKMRSETTEKWWDKPSMNILWNIVSWMILKAWITDITTADLEKAITDKWEAIPLDDLNTNVINTAKGSKFSNDEITSFPKLKFDRGDTHAFHTTIEKEIVLYKKNWEKVTVTKVYDIYLRPECNNLLIIPWSNSQISKLNQADFNMDISSLNTKTIPITLLMIKALGEAISPDKDVPKWESTTTTTRPDVEVWGPIEVPAIDPTTPTF